VVGWERGLNFGQKTEKTDNQEVKSASSPTTDQQACWHWRQELKRREERSITFDVPLDNVKKKGAESLSFTFLVEEGRRHRL